MASAIGVYKQEQNHSQTDPQSGSWPGRLPGLCASPLLPEVNSAHYASASTATELTLRLLCIRSKNEPSFEKTLTGLGFFAAGFMGATGMPMGYG